MEKKIYFRLFSIGMLSLVLTATLIIFIFHEIFDQQAKQDIQITAQTLAATCPHLNDCSELSEFIKPDLRITLVSATGTVLFESQKPEEQTMENHLGRPEIRAALETGTGEATRTSKTFGYSSYYYAIRLEDGKVLRISKTVANLYSVYDKALPAIAGVSVGIIILSLILSSVLTRKIIHPIEVMARNLDEIEQHVPYKELEPSARAIKTQQIRRQENERIRREFTANVSHELKTPLTSISGYAEMIKNGMAQEKDIRDFAGKIHVEAARLITLIGDIIKLSELDETNKTPPHFHRIDLSQIVSETVESLSLVASQKEVTLHWEETPAFVQGNKEMLEELVYNLCDNAIRYNNPGGSVTLLLEEKKTEAGPAQVVFQVQDTGIGIPKEHQERIFERFYRVDKSRSKETGGTGLGLAIVKHIALCHQAQIQVQSAPNKGTCIEVIFPQG